MNAPLDLRMDKPTFLAWVQRQERRYELVGGRPVMQQGGTKDHSSITTQFVVLLSQRLNMDKWTVLFGDLAVDVGPHIRYPEVLVERRVDGTGKDLSTDRPAILVEVLSPSSEDDDFRVKAAEYMALPSLEAYIVASQDAAHCWVWQREQKKEGRPFEVSPSEVKGVRSRIRLRHFGISLPLARIYRGVVR